MKIKKLEIPKSLFPHFSIEHSDNFHQMKVILLTIECQTGTAAQSQISEYWSWLIKI